MKTLILTMPQQQGIRPVQRALSCNPATLTANSMRDSFIAFPDHAVPDQSSQRGPRQFFRQDHLQIVLLGICSTPQASCFRYFTTKASANRLLPAGFAASTLFPDGTLGTNAQSVPSSSPKQFSESTFREPVQHHTAFSALHYGVPHRALSTKPRLSSTQCRSFRQVHRFAGMCVLPSQSTQKLSGDESQQDDGAGRPFKRNHYRIVSTCVVRQRL